MLQLKFIFRNLGRQGFISSINIIGLGIALSFALLLSFYIKTEAEVDTFHKNSSRIYRVLRDNTCAFAPAFAQYTKDHITGIQSYTRVFEMDAVLKHDENIIKTKNCLFVDPDFFSIFSFPLVKGLLKEKNDVLVSVTFAKALFGEEDPQGKSIKINDRLTVYVSGIVQDFKENTHFKRPDVIFSYPLLTEFFGTNYLEQYDLPFFMPALYVLTDENTDMRDKGEELLTLAKTWYWPFKDELNKSIRFQPLKDVYFNPATYGFPSGEREGNKTRLFMMGIIVFCILLIAAINYINLSVAQSIRRAKEVGIKKILGLDRFKIILQSLTETATICILASLLACLFILLSLPVFNDLTGYQIKIGNLISFDFLGIGMLIISILILLAGVFPAFVLSRFQPFSLFGKNIQRFNTTLIQKTLVIFQFTVSIALIISMIILLKQDAYIRNFDIGFNTQETLFVPLNREFKTKMAVFKEELKRLPGIKTISFCNGMPGIGIMPYVFEYKGKQIEFEHLEIDDSYFDVMGVSINNKEWLNNSCLINEKAANILNLSPDSLSLTILVEKNPVTYTIKEIIPNLHFQPLYAEPKPAIFTKVNPDNWAEYAFIRFDTAQLPELIPELRNTYKEFSSIFPFEYHFLNETLDHAYEREYRYTRLITVFAFFTLLISSLGIFALSFFFCQSKLKEFAIRRINGANTSQLWLLITSHFMYMILISFLIACPTAGYFMYKWLNNFTYKTPVEWWIFILAGGIVCVVSLLIVTYQSLQAVKLNPVEIIKNQ